MIRYLFLRNMGLCKLLAFILPAFAVLFGGCSKDSDDDLDVPSNLKVTIITKSPTGSIEFLALCNEANEENPRFTSSKNKLPVSSVWAKQNGKLYYFGDLEASQLSDTKEETRMDLDLSSKLSPSEPYDVYLANCAWHRENNELFFKTELQRGGSFSTYAIIHNPESKAEVMEMMDNTCEVLFIINKSGQPIKFKHKGFDAEKKWYYGCAEVSMDDGHVLNSTEAEEVVSDEVEVPVYNGKKAYRFYSYYVPNGEKVNEAQLIAEINGKEVRSENRISSKIIPQLNHCYGMYAVWDGEKLTLGNENGMGVIELPKDADVTFEDLTIIGNGEKVEIEKDGKFQTDATSAVAFGKDNHIMYISVGSSNTDGKPNTVKLNSMETAITMLLHVLPNMFEPTSGSDFDDIKDLIRQLPETKALAESIDQSIVSHGYLEVNETEDAFVAAKNKIVELAGLKNSYLSEHKSAIKKAPKFTPFSPDIHNWSNQGIRIDVVNSTWNAEKKSWNLNITAYSDRMAYTAVSQCGVLDNEIIPIEDGFEILHYVIQPMSPSGFTGLFKKWEGLKSYYYQTYKVLSDADYSIAEMTWDKQKLENIQMEFPNSEWALYIVSPKDNDYVLAYHICMVILKPVMKLLGEQVSKVFEEKLAQDFFKKLFTPDFVAKCVRAVKYEDKTEFAEMAELYLKEFDKMLKDKAVTLIPDLAKLLAEGEYKNMLKEISEFEKFSGIVLDLISGYTGLKLETSFWMNLYLDFEIHGTQGIIDDIPGTNL